jgi:O-antigen/teichoic acid export membrane protein
MSGIRTTYSGLVSVSVGVITILTGLVCSLIITRSLSMEEYGTWSLIIGILLYAVIIEPMISYWSTRETARSENSQKTSIFAAGLFSSMGMILYLITLLIISDELSINTEIIIFGVILVPGIFLYKVVYAINLGWKPHLASYGLLISEVVKVPIVIALVYFFNMGLVGVIITFFIAQNMSVIFQIYILRDKIKGKIQFKYIRKWLKLSWLSLYNPLSSLIYKTDVLIFVVFSESITGLAIFAVATIVSGIISIADNIVIPTYAKLLAEDKEKYLKENLTLMIYFTTPLGLLSVTFAKPALFLLNPIYEGVSIVVIIITIKIFFSSLVSIFQQYIWGNDKVDKEFGVDSKKFLKSSIFKIPTLKIIDYLGYLILLIVGLIILKQNSVTELDYVIYWASLSAIIQIPLLIYLGIKVRKELKITVDLKSVLKYILTGIMVFSVSVIITEEFLIYNNSIFEFLPQLLLFVIIPITLYIIITYVIDRRTKNLIHAVIKEIKKLVV